MEVMAPRRAEPAERLVHLTDEAIHLHLGLVDAVPSTRRQRRTVEARPNAAKASVSRSMDLRRVE